MISADLALVDLLEVYIDGLKSGTKSRIRLQSLFATMIMVITAALVAFIRLAAKLNNQVRHRRDY